MAESESRQVSKSICSFYKEGKCRFGEDCFNLHSGPSKELKKKKSIKPKIMDSDSKKSMKTAEDVIKRIQWDEMLPAECFTIGYVDRFVGIVEDEFTKFSNWGSLVRPSILKREPETYNVFLNKG